MALLNGVFTANKNPAELNMRSFAGNILRLFPNGTAPIFALSSQSGKSVAKATTHGYFTKTMTFIKTTSTGIDALGATTLNLADTVGMSAGMVLFNTRTKENVLVLTIPNATTITVTRAFGRIAAAATAAADQWIQVGTAFYENSTRPTSRQLATVYVPNFTQIFRNAWAISDSARASFGEMGYSNIAESRRDCSLFHSSDIEAAILWGQAKMDTTGSTPIHATQGVIDAISQYAPGNVTTAGATTTFAQLVAMVEGAFRYSTDLSNPKERVAFCDAQTLKVLHELGRIYGLVEITQSETSFGMQFSQFKFYKGKINLIEHPLMNGLGGTSGIGNGSMLVMDMPALKLAYMNGRDTIAEEYNAGDKGASGAAGIDGSGGSLTTELSVELINPYSCAYVTGLTAAV